MENSPKTLVCVAWPYANGPLHLGHVAGAYLPADIFARYKRQRGHDVLMVSGSDAHGTPIMVRAEEQCVEPELVVRANHERFLDLWRDLRIDFDLFTSTMTKNHEQVVQDFIRVLADRGYIYEKESQQFFDDHRRRFLPDRYVEGTCPHCAYPDARGDQCESCGRTLDPHELVDPRSRLSGTPPVLRSTKHLFFRLSSVQDELAEWLSTKDQWRVHVRNWSEAFVRGGLLDRPITRDLTWGTPVPAEWGLGEDKRIYVWFEAVMGYLSATIEYCASKGTKWQDWWVPGDEEVESVYFVGKDNIPFHTVIWPGMLRAHGGLRLPTNVPASQYVILGGRKASKSAGVGRTAADYLSWMSADALRYALASELPEASDNELDDKQLVRRINDELASGWGNLVNRLLVMSKKYINGGHIPELGLPESSELLHSVDQVLVEASAALDRVEIRRALRTLMTGVQSVNAYVSQKEPWIVARTDAVEAQLILIEALAATMGLAVGLRPFLPASSDVILSKFGINPAACGWARPALVRGIELPSFNPLFPRVTIPGDDD